MVLPHLTIGKDLYEFVRSPGYISLATLYWWSGAVLHFWSIFFNCKCLSYSSSVFPTESFKRFYWRGILFSFMNLRLANLFRCRVSQKVISFHIKYSYRNIFCIIKTKTLYRILEFWRDSDNVSQRKWTTGFRLVSNKYFVAKIY